MLYYAVVFFVIALIVYGIVNLLNALVATLFGSGAGIAVLLALITDVVALVGTFWLQGALVYAVDVGHGQLDPRLASDPRVVVMDAGMCGSVIVRMTGTIIAMVRPEYSTNENSPV